MRMRVGGMMILCGLMAVCAAVQVSCNEYTCDNGTATAGNPPGTGNVSQCASCNPGYHKEGNGCAINEYMCANGMKMDNGEPGGVHDDEFCMSCDGGYVLENNACRRARYICPANGMPQPGGPQSGTIDVTLCASCDDTYFLQTDNSCQTIPGSGTTTDPYQLDTYEELDTIRNDLDAHYALTADIDAIPSWSAGTDGCVAYTGSNGDSAGCTGWEPIGSISNPFIGTLDGQGNTISNLYINSQSTAGVIVGMFSTISDAEILDIGLIDIFVVGRGTFAGDL